MKKTIITLIFVFFGVSLGQAITVKGNNIIWSPASSSEFIYAIYGKSSGNVMWKKYDVKDNQEETIFYGNSLVPLWSYDGKYIIFTRNNALVLTYSNKEKEYKVAAPNIASFDISLQSDKVVYSDNEKIYICELKNNNNYFFVNGSSPFFIDKDKKVIFLDDNLKANIVDEDMKTKVVLTNMVKKIVPVKNDNKFLFLENNQISLFDLTDSTIYPVVSDDSEIQNFGLSQDFGFLAYNNNAGDVYLVHIPTRLKVQILNDKAVFDQKLSSDNRFCAFEKNNLTMINNVEKYISTFNLNSVYKISLGMKDGLKNGTSVEVYEEKKNPFTQKVIGYDENSFKGVLKIVSVFNSYSYGVVDQDMSTDKTIQQGNVVLWKEKNITGTIE